MEHSHDRPPEMLYQRRERLLRLMAEGVGMFFELEKNIANRDGMTPSTTKELHRSRKEVHSDLNKLWLQLERLDNENRE